MEERAGAVTITRAKWSVFLYFAFVLHVPPTTQQWFLHLGFLRAASSQVLAPHELRAALTALPLSLRHHPFPASCRLAPHDVERGNFLGCHAGSPAQVRADRNTEVLQFTLKDLTYDVFFSPPACG